MARVGPVLADSARKFPLIASNGTEKTEKQVLFVKKIVHLSLN